MIGGRLVGRWSRGNKLIHGVVGDAVEERKRWMVGTREKSAHLDSFFFVSSTKYFKKKFIQNIFNLNKKK